MLITQAAFDYRDLPEEDRQFVKVRAEGIRQAAKRTAESILLIGQWLAEVKARMPHGAWLPWLKTEFGWDQKTAWRFMQVYEAVKLGNLPNLASADLHIDASALYLLVSAKTPGPVREEAIRRAESGEPISRRSVNELIEHYERTQETPTPAIARRIAIATGAATLSTDHRYVLPMTAEEEEKLEEEQFRIRNLYSAIEAIAEAELTPAEMVVLGRKHFCRQLGGLAERAAAWLNAVARGARE